MRKCDPAANREVWAARPSFCTPQASRAWLLSVYFLGDYFQDGKRTFPKTEAEWRPFIDAAKKALALPEQHALSDCTHEAFVPASPA